MDALQIISQSSLKAEKPAVQIGDYVRIAVRIREGDKERTLRFTSTSKRETEREFRFSREPSLQRTAPELPRPSPSAAFPTAVAWSGYSPSTPPT